MKPKSLSDQDWQKLTKKFKTLNLNQWNNFDGLQKLSLLRGAKISLNKAPIFGKNYLIKYPNDIYLYSHTNTNMNTYKFDATTLNKLRKTALYDDNEIGGTINYKTNSIPTIDVKFIGGKNRINLNNQEKNHTLFHTHPKDDMIYDPPSILDITSYLALIVKHIADLILNLSRGIAHSPDDTLIIQNSMVFTKDEVYVYYISKPLLETITKKLINLFRSSTDYIFQVEKLLEEIELNYCSNLFKFNHDLSNIDLSNYFSFLSSLGFLIKRFTYLDPPEVFYSN